MTSVDDLFRRFREAHRAGRPDPTPFLDQLDAPDRRELEALVDHYLRTRPAPRAYDPRGFAEDALAQRVLASVSARLDERETWQTLLPRARAEAGIGRPALVRRLAEELGAAHAERRVGDYYHDMETGRLPPEGVSDRVLEALGRIVRVPAARLRAAGRALTPPALGGGAAVYARTAAAAPAPMSAPPPREAEPPGSSPEHRTEAAAAPSPPSRDEVDELFTGGAD